MTNIYDRISGRWGGAEEWDDIRIDALTNAFIGLTHEHHHVHAGDSFVAGFTDNAMADNDTLIVAFLTPPGTQRVHMVIQFSTLVGGDIQVWEGATWTNRTGSLLPIINRKRETVMTAPGILEDQAQVGFLASGNLIENPTGLGTGSATSIRRVYAWGKKEKFMAGGGRDSEEMLLRPATQYAIVFTAEGNNNKGQVELNWYEHVDSH